MKNIIDIIDTTNYLFFLNFYLLNDMNDEISSIYTLISVFSFLLETLTVLQADNILDTLSITIYHIFSYHVFNIKYI